MTPKQMRDLPIVFKLSKKLLFCQQEKYTVESLGQDSQNFLSKLLKFYVTSGLKILIFWIIMFFKLLSLKVNVTSSKLLKTYYLGVIGSQMQLKITKILPILLKKFGEFWP
jgi:hypothetical protein